jgi:hypothetical protein
MDAVLKMVGRARTRLMLGRFRQLAVYHVAAAVALATLAAWIVRPGGPTIFWMYLGGAGAGLVSAAIHAASSRPSVRTAALALDHASGLRERFATALLVRSGTSPAELAVIEDASRHAGSADPGRIPLGDLRRAWWPAVPPLLFVASLALPSFARDPNLVPSVDPLASIPVPAPIRKEESTGLRRRAFDLERAAGERDIAELKELAQSMRQISEEIRRSELSQSEALAKLSRLEDKARERKKELAEEAGIQGPHMNRSDGGQASAASDQASRRAEELDRKVQEIKAKLEKAKEELAKAGPDGKSPEVLAALAELGRQLEGLESKDAGALGRELEKLAGEGDAEALEKMLESIEGEMENLEGLLEGMDLLDSEIEELQAMKGRFAGEGKACLFCGRKGEG